MGRPQRFALALLCATAAVAGAASVGGFEWPGIENPATPIWNRGAAGGATVASADAGPLRAVLAHAVASVAAGTTSPHRARPEPAADPATADPGRHETAFGLAGVSAAEAPAVEAPSPDAGPTPPPETHERLVSLFRPEAPVEEQAQPAVRPIEIVDECLVVDICIDEYRSEEHTSELQSLTNIVCRLLPSRPPPLSPPRTLSRSPPPGRPPSRRLRPTLVRRRRLKPTSGWCLCSGPRRRWRSRRSRLCARLKLSTNAWWSTSASTS